MGKDTWFKTLNVGDKVWTGFAPTGGVEIIRKKYEKSFMLGFDANGRDNLAPDGFFPIAVAGCKPINFRP